MKEIDINRPILVTGGSGYIASWIVKQLLEGGRHVRTTVRDRFNKEKGTVMVRRMFWSQFEF